MAARRFAVSAVIHRDMRIAFSGAHRTGKTTLIEAVSALSPRYKVLEEPYYLLEEEGYEFSDPPTAEDFERQLERSWEIIEEAPANALIDRCPLDFLAYLRALDEDVDLDEHLDAVREALEKIDLVVVVSIESPDRVALPSHEDRRLRRDVDEQIRSMILDDGLGLGLNVLEVHGTVEERTRQVTQAIR